MASFKTRPGTLSGNRKALTRTEVSTTALFGIETSGLVDRSQNFGFLFGGWLAPGDADGFQQNCAAFRHLCFEVVAFLQPSRFAYIARQGDLGSPANLNERHRRFSWIKLNKLEFRKCQKYYSNLWPGPQA